jgi:hypothetical protein
MNERATHDRYRFDVTHGWVAGDGSAQVWYLGGRGTGDFVTLATNRPAWREVTTHADLLVRGVAFDADDNAVLVSQRSAWASELEVWRVESGKDVSKRISVASLPLRSFVDFQFGALYVARSGNRFACVAGRHGYVFDVARGVRLATFPLPDPAPPKRIGGVANVTLSDTGRVFATFAGDGRAGGNVPVPPGDAGAVLPCRGLRHGRSDGVGRPRGSSDGERARPAGAMARVRNI